VKLYTKSDNKFVAYTISDIEKEKNNAINNYNYLVREIDNIKNEKQAKENEKNKDRAVITRDTV